MSTKNIGRTAIEGGRTNASKYQRRMSLRWRRHEVRAAMHQIQVDPELADEIVLPVREFDSSFDDKFADKLAAPSRWLAKKGIGKSVDEIKGLLLQTFDTSSLAGRHLVFGHLMPHTYKDRVFSPARRSYANVDFDADGILRDLGKTGRRSKAPKKLKIRARQWLKNLALPEGWKIRLEDGRHCIIYPTDRTKLVECTSSWCLHSRSVFGHPKVFLNGKHRPAHSETVYAVFRELTKVETLMWKAVSGTWYFR